jgi:hypothetical protein
MKNNQRLFTFGCSFTNYHYPTWADIVATGFDEYQNWGKPGAGNNFILNSLIECHSRNVLNKDDTVIILWSGLARTDYYQINHWGHLHNQYFDSKNKNTTYSCPQGYEILSYAWFISAIMLLNQLNVNWKMFHWQQFDTDTDSYKLYQDLLCNLTHAPFNENTHKYKKIQITEYVLAENLYARLSGPSWPKLNSIIDRTFIDLPFSPNIKDECYKFLQMLDKELASSKRYTEDIDLHPSPLQHLSWVQKFLPDYTVDQKTIDWVADIDHKLLNQQAHSFTPNRPVRF